MESVRWPVVHPLHGSEEDALEVENGESDIRTEEFSAKVGLRGTQSLASWALDVNTDANYPT